MKALISVLIGVLTVAFIGPTQVVLAEVQDHVITAHEMTVPKEEYQLRLLEEQIELLRDKLFMNGGTLDTKASKEWHAQYNAIRATLNNWNDSLDGIH